MEEKKSRRSFLKNVLVGAAVLPIINNINTKTASAQDAPTNALETTDQMASVMGYNPDNTKIDKAKYPKYADGQMCKLCTLFLEGGKSVAGHPGEYGKCGLFTGGLVSANGWCNSFVAKIG